MNENAIRAIQEEITSIKSRNKKVETDKAWELSLFRKMVVAALTYIMIVIFFIFAELPNPWTNAVVPAAAFFLSTLTMPLFKKIWEKYFLKNPSN